MLISFSSLHADPQGGLVMRSYESNQDQRTSLEIPASYGKLRLGNYLSLSFNVKARSGIDPFGYVCRILVGSIANIDVVLNNPPNKEPFIGLIQGKTFLGKMAEGPALYEWLHIELELVVRGDSLVIREKGTQVTATIALPDDRRLRIVFGACPAEGFVTTDVAPVIISDLVLGTRPGKAGLQWPLRDPAGEGLLKDVSGKPCALLSYPQWVQDRHIHWRRVWEGEFDDKAFPVVSGQAARIWLVIRQSVLEFDPATETVAEHRFTPELPMRWLCDQFAWYPPAGRLAYYDFDMQPDSVLSLFDPTAGAWSRTIARTQSPTILHHSKFLSPVDSSLVQLFGYGLHRYLGTMHRIDTHGRVRVDQLPQTVIPPRYLCAIGLADSVAYLYGGIGNELGQQEYGIHIYNDLYRLCLRDYSLTPLWNRSGPQCDEIAASNLVIDPGGREAKGLFFAPGRSQSYLLLKQMDLV
ncbi:MAG: hypothetical protein LBU95_00390, partial [Rikenellaceae bacterium]|nr:hypothetical protein [Rikenellaceae bacterium]